MTTYDHAAEAINLTFPAGWPDAVGQFLAACPDDLAVPTVALLEAELNEAAAHADPDGVSHPVTCCVMVAVYRAAHPRLHTDRTRLLHDACTAGYDGQPPAAFAGWLSDLLGETI